MNRRAVSAASLLLVGLVLAACTNAHKESAGRLLTHDSPVPTTEAPVVVDAAPDTPSTPTTPTTVDVGPADPTPVLRPHAAAGGRAVSTGGGGRGAGPGHTVAAAAPPKPVAFGNLAPPGATPKVWAVVIGIQAYQGRTHATVGGRGDAAAFMQELSNAHWPADHILELVDGDATIGNIRQAMQWLTQHSAPDTFTLFHYSGHVCIQSSGPCGANHMYLWSVDNQFISDDEFGNNMRNLQGKAWVDIAGCEAAAFDKGISSPQRLFTAASQANEKGYEDPNWHESVWTGYSVDQGMLQGQADGNGDHVVTVQEAVNWAAPRAANDTQGQDHGSQHPDIAGGQDAGPFDLAAMAAPPPPPPSNNNGGGNGGGGGQPPPPSPSPGCNDVTKSVLHC